MNARAALPTRAATSNEPTSRKYVTVYTHSFNQLRHGNTSDLYDAMQEHQLPAMNAAGARLVGCWESLAEHGHWPESVELWEYDDFDHLRRVLSAMHGPGEGDSKALREWIHRRGDWIASSQGYTCLKSELTPTAADMSKRGLRAAMVIHESMTVASSRQPEYLKVVEDMYWPRIAEPAGRTLIGLYWSPWKATRAFNLWGTGPDWDSVSIIANQEGQFRGRDNELWMTLGREIRTDWDDRFLVPAPFSPIH
jgi:hypothetical protein